MITLQRDNNNNVMPITRLGDNINLDGSSAHDLSGVISATDGSVVRLACAEPIYFAVGEEPEAADGDGIILIGEISFYLPAGEQVSVYGGEASLTVLQ